MLAARTWFSFAEIPDPAQHRAYNEWHQLDHRPENLALPGVIHGERWVRTPDCAAAAPAPDPALEGAHYLNSYWFRPPVEQAVKEWSELGERSFQWGRRADLRIAKRPLMGMFLPVKGYTNPRVLVSPDVLPLRPNRGVHLEVAEVHESHSLAAEETFAWYDRVRIPDLLECRGAAGAWTFSSQSVTFGVPRYDPNGPSAEVNLRVLLVFLDEDPLEFVADLESRTAGWRRAGRLPDRADSERKLFAGPLRSIAPWQWDWFDARPEAG
jgi:hypothetical protein